MRKPSFILLLVALAISICGHAQSGTSTDQKPHSNFTYQGKPIPPLALLPFIPGMDPSDTIRPWVVDLKDMASSAKVVTDTFRRGWFSSYYDCNSFEQCSIQYKVIQRIKEDRVVLLVYWNGGGTLTYPYVFILSVKDDKIYRVGNFLADQGSKNGSQSVEVKVNEIVNGGIHYKIPE